MTSKRKSGLNVVVRSFFALLFVAFIIQSTIPVTAANASTPQFHTVTFVENDSPSDSVFSSQTANAQTALTPFASLNPSFVNSGFIFINWNSSPDGTGTSYANGSAFSFATAEVLYATWARIDHTVTFVENASPSDSVSSSQTANVQTALTSFANLSPSFVDSGFTFVDWNSESDGSGVAYGDGSNYSFTAPIVLYAIWSPTIAIDTLTFDANGGSGSIDPIIGSPGSTITLPDQSGLIHPGFELTRWNTSASGAGTSYSVGQAFKLAGSTVLYAQWSGHKPASLFGAIGTFKTGSSSLSAALKSQINHVASTIKSRKYLKVDLFGYTAPTGLRSLNVSLSRARAHNVAVYLRSRLNVLKVRGVTIFSTGEGAIAGQSSNAYSRVEVFGV